MVPGIMPKVQAYAEEVLNQKDEAPADSLPPSSRLAAATERLLGALDRLELAVSSGRENIQENSQLAHLEHENAELRDERIALSGAIDRLRAEYGDLHRTASGIYNKLEDSIRRLTQIMKE